MGSENQPLSKEEIRKKMRIGTAVFLAAVAVILGVAVFMNRSDEPELTDRAAKIQNLNLDDNDRLDAIETLNNLVIEYRANTGAYPAGNGFINSSQFDIYTESVFRSGDLVDPGTGVDYRLVNTRPNVGEIQFLDNAQCLEDGSLALRSVNADWAYGFSVLLSTGEYYCLGNTGSFQRDTGVGEAAKTDSLPITSVNSEAPASVGTTEDFLIDDDDSSEAVDLSDEDSVSKNAAELLFALAIEYQANTGAAPASSIVQSASPASPSPTGPFSEYVEGLEAKFTNQTTGERMRFVGYTPRDIGDIQYGPTYRCGDDGLFIANFDSTVTGNFAVATLLTDGTIYCIDGL